MMRVYITLILKDFYLLARDRLALLLLLLAPIVVISAAGLSLSTLYRSTDHTFPVADLDGGEAARALVESLRSAPELRVLEVDPEEALRLVAETPQAGAALLIRDGFTESLGTAEPLPLELLVDPVKHLEALKIRAAVERARAGLATVRIASRIAVVQVVTHAGGADFEDVAEDSAALARKLGETAVPLAETSVFGGSTEYNTFDHSVPGFSVTFLLLGMLFGVGLGMLDEREWGMAYRLAAGPVTPSMLIIGKMTSRFVIGVAQMALLFAFGYLAFGISLGSSLVGLALVIVAVAYSSAAFGLLAAAAAPSRDAVLPLGTIAVVAMAAVGGCWWPITIEPLWLQRAAHVFPTAWAMGAFNDLMIRQRTLSDVLPAVVALWAFGTLYVLVGARLQTAPGESG